jgi:hypothetical protein
MRRFLICVSMLALANCGGGDIPNSGYVPQQEQRIRDAALAGIPAPVEVEAGELETTSPDFTQEDPDQPVDLDASVQPTRPSLDNPGLSDEQDFSAVSDRQTIESDAARLERNRTLYKVIEPTAIPRRPGTNTPNVVEYAIRTNNPVGAQLYSRGPFATQGRFQRNCQKYASDAAAQEAFLAAGGPEKDRQGLDPDGDGFACYWNPEPFRLVRKR